MNGDTYESLSREFGGRMDPDTWEAAAETARILADTEALPGDQLYWLDVELDCKSNAARIRDVLG